MILDKTIEGWEAQESRWKRGPKEALQFLIIRDLREMETRKGDWGEIRDIGIKPEERMLSWS